MGESQRLTEEFVRSTVANYGILSARIEAVAWVLMEIQGNLGSKRNWVYQNFNFDTEVDGTTTLYGNFTEWYCGQEDSECVQIPLEYLWMENFAEVEQKRYAAACAEAKRLAEEKEAREKADLAVRMEEQERKTYERLKAKFGA